MQIEPLPVRLARSSPAEDESGRPSLASEARRLEAVFAAAVARRDHAAAVAAILDLEGAIIEWSRDTLQSDHADRAGPRCDPWLFGWEKQPAKGCVARRRSWHRWSRRCWRSAAARAEKRFDLADEARTLLVSAGVEVRNTPGGTQWLLPEHGRS